MKTALILLIALALLGASPALAAKGDKWIGLQLGRTASATDIQNFDSGGLVYGLTGTYMGSEHLGVGGDVAFHPWAGPDNASSVADELFRSRFASRTIQTTMHVVYDFRTGGVTRPYAQAGFGFFSSVHNTYTRFNTAYHVGAGVNFNGFGVGGAYHIAIMGGPDARFYTFGVNMLWGLGGK